MSRQFVFVISAMIVLVLLMTGCTQGNTAAAPTGKAVQAQKESVKFGIIAPLTGDGAQFGEALTKAMDIVKSELKGQDTHFSYEFSIEDDQLQNAKSVSAFQKLTSIDGASAVLLVASGAGNAVAPLAEQQKILACAIASDGNIVKGRKYVFKHWVTTQAEAQKYVEELDRRGLKTVALVGLNQQGVRATLDSVKELIPGRIVSEEYFEPGTKDFRTIILKVKEKNPDTLLFETLPGPQTAFMQQLSELGYTGDVSSIEGFEYEPEALPYLEGRWYINSAEESGHFKEEYEKMYGTKPLVASGNAYDCLRLMIRAYEDTQSKDPATVMSELHNIKDYDGALGKVYLDDGNSVQSQAAVKEVRNGTFVVIR
jgi:branched-chain amino acid transport system substrate-binding protein